MKFIVYTSPLVTSLLHYSLISPLYVMSPESLELNSPLFAICT